MSGCNLSWDILSALTSALSSAPTNLRELDLSYNNMYQFLHNLKGVLDNPQCRLETLRSTHTFSFHYYNSHLLHFMLIHFFDLELVDVVCFYSSKSNNMFSFFFVQVKSTYLCLTGFFDIQNMKRTK